MELYEYFLAGIGIALILFLILNTIFHLNIIPLWVNNWIWLGLIFATGAVKILLEFKKLIS